MQTRVCCALHRDHLLVCLLLCICALLAVLVLLIVCLIVGPEALKRTFGSTFPTSIQEQPWPLDLICNGLVWVCYELFVLLRELLVLTCLGSVAPTTPWLIDVSFPESLRSHPTAVTKWIRDAVDHAIDHRLALVVRGLPEAGASGERWIDLNWESIPRLCLPERLTAEHVEACNERSSLWRWAGVRPMSEAEMARRNCSRTVRGFCEQVRGMNAPQVALFGHSVDRQCPMMQGMVSRQEFYQAFAHSRAATYGRFPRARHGNSSARGSPAPSAASFGALFHSVDRDRSGAISPAELQAFAIGGGSTGGGASAGGTPAATDGGATWLLARLGLTSCLARTGRTSSSPLTQVSGAGPNAGPDVCAMLIRRAFARLDWNRDGAVDWREWRASRDLWAGIGQAESVPTVTTHACTTATAGSHCADDSILHYRLGSGFPRLCATCDSTRRQGVAHAPAPRHPAAPSRAPCHLAALHPAMP